MKNGAVVKNGALVLFIGDDTGLSCLGIMKWPWESWLLKQPGFHGLEDDRRKKKVKKSRETFLGTCKGFGV